MKRIPAVVWILLPLALGLLYVGVYHVVAPQPTLATVVPGSAVLTQRFRDLSVLDEVWWRPGPGRPSDEQADARNLPGLAGVDRHGPVHVVFLPRATAPDPTMVILPVADASALRSRFEDPAYFLVRVRHAQFLEVRGDYAAISGDRDAVRRLGEGGITATDLGEDHALAVDVRGAIEFALHAPSEPPWNLILPALGFDPARAETDETGRVSVVLAERLLRVYESWEEARLWSWLDEGRMRAELVPAPESGLARALSAIVETPTTADPALPLPPTRAQAWLRLPGGRERVAFIQLLYAAGVPLPRGPDATEAEPLGVWGRARAPYDRGLLLWTTPAPGTGYAWTLGIAGPSGSLPPLGPFHSAFDAGGDAEVAKGELPLTLADTQLDREAPAGRILWRRTDTLDAVFAGPTAEAAWHVFETWLARRDSRASEGEPPPADGWSLVATFGLSEPRARTLLGGALERGGFLRPLFGGRLRGEILTDGRVLRIEVRVER